jgi:DNA primase
VRSVARELRESLVDVRAVLEGLGIPSRRDGSGYKVSCPAHKERTPSCSVRLAKDGTIACRCHGCGWSADALGLVALVHGLDVRRDFAAVLRRAAELAGRWDLLDARPFRPARPPIPRPRPAPPSVPLIDPDAYHAIASFLLEHCPLRGAPDVAAYLDARHIFADAEAVGVRALPRDQRPLVAHLLEGFGRDRLVLAGVLRRDRDAIDWGQTHRVLIPWSGKDGQIHAVQRRRLDASKPKYLFPPGLSPREPFGAEVYAEALASFGGQAEVIVCEGAFDTLARRKLSRVRGERCVLVGIPSASTFSPTWSTYFAGRHVVIAFDGDDAGDRAAERFAAEVCAGAASLTRERPHGAKDCNDVLTRELAA